VTDTPLDLDAWQARIDTCRWIGMGLLPDDADALLTALRKAEAERDEQARFKEAQRADKRKARALLSEWRMRGMRAEAQVTAVLALCDEAAPRRMGDGYLSASVLAPEDVRAAVDGAS